MASKAKKKGRHREIGRAAEVRTQAGSSHLHAWAAMTRGLADFRFLSIYLISPGFLLICNP